MLMTIVKSDKTTVKLFLLSLVVYGCASSGPKTQYYSLFPADYSVLKTSVPKTDSVFDRSLGVGPISLPEYVDHPGIVSLSGTNQITVSGYNAWAGDLNENIARVVAANLVSQLGNHEISAFPWDNRARPDYQVRIMFQEFAGIRGGEVKLKAKWTVLNSGANNVVLSGVDDLREQALSGSYNDYVAALNRLLDRLSSNMAEKIKTLDDR